MVYDETGLSADKITDMRLSMKSISGNIADVVNGEIYPGTLMISKGKIVAIVRDSASYDTFILPGFIDAHVHIESSMLAPSEFARIAAVHGTVACVSDPHEIANVLGIEGVRYMIENARSVPVRFYFGAPSCVPATEFEKGGAVIGPEEVEELLRMDEIRYLAEVMNFPGVIHAHPDVLAKIRIAKKYGRPIDGHAPGLRGHDLQKYSGAGISTDHETLSREEAVEKISRGMKIMIREGSAAKNFDELVSLIEEYPEWCMFCSDDKHPDDLVTGHINDLVKRAVRCGIDPLKVLKAACVNPVFHYRLNNGLLRTGDSADFLVADNLMDFTILKTVIKGEVIADSGKSLIPRVDVPIVNRFNAKRTKAEDVIIPSEGRHIRIIEAIDGQVVTGEIIGTPLVERGIAVSDTARDILKIVLVSRYRHAKPAIGFVHRFGLLHGAIASSIAHDSHNIIAVGTSDEDICRAVNLIFENKGGICAISSEREMILPLPVAGIMSDGEYQEVAAKYSVLDKMAKDMGSPLHAPFMTLSFMALPVIPKLKITGQGLFDAEKFRFADTFIR
jgi:adenine deaminase